MITVAKQTGGLISSGFKAPLRLGRVSVTGYLIRTSSVDQLKWIQAAFRDFLVLDVQHDFVRDVINYKGLALADGIFEEIGPDEVIPNYTITFTRHDDGTVTHAFERTKL